MQLKDLGAFWRAAFVLSGLLSLVATPVEAGRLTDVQVLLGEMNQARASQHLLPLRLDQSLSRLAYTHVLDMVHRNYYSHDTPEGQSPFARMKASNIRFGYAGENLAVDQSAETIFTDFWNSSEHRENMLGAHYSKVGIAAVETRDGTVVVEDFSD